MIEFLEVDNLETAVDKLYRECAKTDFATLQEEVLLLNSLDRILSEDLISEVEVPNFNRSTVDGYAVVAIDTNAASDTVPVILNVVGSVEMGMEYKGKVNSSECVYVPTGGMIPDGAGAVVMIEDTEQISENKIVVYKSIGEGKNIVVSGDDVKKEDLILHKGKKITPYDIGLLSSVGIEKFKVYNKLNVTIISTGDELISDKEKLSKGKVLDINSNLLESMAIENGLNVTGKYLLQDNEKDLENAITNSMGSSDIILISGGSSKGKKDLTSFVIDKVSSSGVLTHGIAIQPGKPTITSFDEKSKTMIIGLPGHPIASAILFRLVVLKVIDKIRKVSHRERTCTGILTENVPASQGRATIQLVNIDDNFNIIPLFGKSGLIHRMSKSDGYVLIDRNKEGYNKGEKVKVYYL